MKEFIQKKQARLAGQIRSAYIHRHLSAARMEGHTGLPLAIKLLCENARGFLNGLSRELEFSECV
jgi:hypothetical protein